MAPEGAPLIISSRLLLLPVEIRQEILYYALLGPVSSGDPNDAIKVRLGKNDFEPSILAGKEKSKNYYWGTERRTRLLRVNRQLHAEAEEVLYTSFLFCFPPRMSLVSLRKFIRARSRRSLRLIRHVELSLYLVLKPVWWVGDVSQEPSAGDSQLHEFAHMIRQWEMYKVIVAELPGLRDVRLQLSSEGFQPTPRERQRMVNFVVRLAGMFRTVKRLELMQKDEMLPCRSGLVQECIDRFRKKDCVEARQ